MINSAVKLLDNAVLKCKTKIALEDDKNSYTYEEYQKLSLSIGSKIIAMKDNINSQIALYLPKSAKSLISFMGILYSGNSYVPLDINMPKTRLGKIINHLMPSFIITDFENSETLINEIGYDKNNILIYDEIINYLVDRKKIDEKLFKIIDTDPIYIMYTSGSTGMPKGVVIPHKGVIDYANWVVETFDLDNNTVFGNQAPFHFDNSILDIYGALLCCGKINIIPEIFFNFPVKLPEYINQKNINLIFWVPTVIINVANSGVLSDIKMDSLKKVLFCGEVMPNKQLNIWRKTHPEIIYANLYGPTEITDVCTYHMVEKKYGDAEPLPIGIPCQNVSAIILNEEDKEAKTNEIGELCILGTGLALGYFKEPELTNKAFLQNPLNDKYRELIYRTGDLVLKNDEGLFIYLGRKDSQIKHKGNRIELGEIETIAKSIDEVSNACVLYDDDKKEIVLIAEVTGIKKRELFNKMRKQLPSYMIPTRLITMNKIPLNANGKLDRVYLKTILGSELNEYDN